MITLARHSQSDWLSDRKAPLRTLPRSVTWTLVEVTALIGYARVSKADGSQVIDLQRDAQAKTDVDLSTSLYRCRIGQAR